MIKGNDRARFWSHVSRTDAPSTHRPDLGPCWLWTAAVGSWGHGKVRFGGKQTTAHVMAHELFIGPIPDGYHVDHLCKVPSCVRPSHLEAVTPEENRLRSDCWSAVNSRKTHCPAGHEYGGSNLYRNPSGRRICRVCAAAAQRRYKARRRAEQKEAA